MAHVLVKGHSAKLVKSEFDKVSSIPRYDECCDEEIHFKYLAFVIIDVVSNTSGLTRNQIETLLLEKVRFWIGTLVTQHQGLNSTYHWNRSKQTEREKIKN